MFACVCSILLFASPSSSFPQTCLFPHAFLLLPHQIEGTQLLPPPLYRQLPASSFFPPIVRTYITLPQDDMLHATAPIFCVNHWPPFPPLPQRRPPPPPPPPPPQWSPVGENGRRRKCDLTNAPSSFPSFACLSPPKGNRLTLHFFPLVMCKCTSEERIPGIVGGRWNPFCAPY